VWGQLVRAADTTSNKLVEADDAVSEADFLNKMGIALREAKESRTELMKLRLGNLDNYPKTAKLELESEATQLTANRQLANCQLSISEFQSTAQYLRATIYGRR
jgi:four helix bundle protein